MRRLLGVGLLGLGLLGACDATDASDPRPLTDTLIISDSSATSSSPSPSSHGVALSTAAQVTGGEMSVAYISLAPGSYDGGVLVRIRSPRISGTVSSPMIEGGLDPVPIPATAGDSIEIDVLGGGSVVLAQTGKKVPVSRRPRVVRTVPPRGKTDVAINAVVVVVFTEPVRANSISSATVQLFRGATAVAGTVGLLQGVTAAVAFQPTQPLDPNTDYRLVVRPEVRDLDGDPLEQEVAVEFRSGSTFAPEVSQLIVLPDITALGIGSRLQLITRAFGGDDTTRVPIPIAGVPILWSTENPAVATVSTTGLVTAVAAGETRIRAQVLDNLGVAGSVQILVGASTAIAALELSPASDTTPVTGKIELSAIARDAGGNVLPFRPTTWTTTNASVATVEQAAGGKAWVTGLSPGRASIIGTSDSRSDTATVEVVSPGPYQVMSLGYNGTCGLRGGVWAFCWGENASGKVGDGTSNSWQLPHAVSRALRVVQISTGGGNTCALTAEGQARCWGANSMGALGIGSTNGPEQCEFAGPCSRTPIAVLGDRSFSAIYVNRHAGWYQFVCGLASDGAAYCWGSNYSGTLGIGATTGPATCTAQGGTPLPCSTVPLEIAGGQRFTSLTLGDIHACGLTAAGEAHCWGDNSYGQLGDGTETDRSTPVTVIGGLEFVSLSAGSRHTCGLTSDGSAHCWGFSGEGALGHGGFTGPDFCQNPDPFGRPFACSTAPERVAGGLTFATIAAGGDHTCGVTAAGAAYCWGFNSWGQLGNASTNSSAAPVAVTGGLTFANLSGGREHTCGVTTGSVAYCWGFPGNYALGTDDLPLPVVGVPIPVEGQP